MTEIHQKVIQSIINHERLWWTTPWRWPSAVIGQQERITALIGSLEHEQKAVEEAVKLSELARESAAKATDYLCAERGAVNNLSEQLGNAKVQLQKASETISGLEIRIARSELETERIKAELSKTQADLSRTQFEQAREKDEHTQTRTIVRLLREWIHTTHRVDIPARNGTIKNILAGMKRLGAITVLFLPLCLFAQFPPPFLRGPYTTNTAAWSQTNVISLSTTNATSKPLTNHYQDGVLTLFGLEAGANITLTHNPSNIVITGSGGAGDAGGTNARQFGTLTLTNLSGTGAVTNVVSLSTTNTTSKPITNHFETGILTLFGIEQGSGHLTTVNESNIVTANDWIQTASTTNVSDASNVLSVRILSATVWTNVSGVIRPVVANPTNQLYFPSANLNNAISNTVLVVSNQNFVEPFTNAFLRYYNGGTNFLTIDSYGKLNIGAEQNKQGELNDFDINIFRVTDQGEPSKAWINIIHADTWPSFTKAGEWWANAGNEDAITELALVNPATSANQNWAWNLHTNFNSSAFTFNYNASDLVRFSPAAQSGFVNPVYLTDTKDTIASGNLWAWRNRSTNMMQLTHLGDLIVKRYVEATKYILSNQPGLDREIRMYNTNGQGYTALSSPTNAWVPTNRMFISITNPAVGEVLEIQSVSYADGVASIVITNAPDNSGGGGGLTTNANQFGASVELTIKSGAFLTNMNYWGDGTNHGDLWVDGDIFALTDNSFVLGDTGQAWFKVEVKGGGVHFEETGAGTDFVGIEGPASIAFSYPLILPNAQGADGQIITNNGAGALGWWTPGGPLGFNQNQFASNGNLVSIKSGALLTNTLFYPSNLTGPATIHLATTAQVTNLTEWRNTNSEIHVSISSNANAIVYGRLDMSNAVAFRTNNIDFRLPVYQAFTNALQTNLVLQLTNVYEGVTHRIDAYGAGRLGNGRTNAWQLFCTVAANNFIYWPPGTTNGNFDVLVNSNQIVSFTFMGGLGSTNILAAYRVLEGIGAN